MDQDYLYRQRHCPGIPLNTGFFSADARRFAEVCGAAPSVACQGFAFDAELIAKAHKQGFIIVEVLITWSDKSNSKVSVARQALPMLKVPSESPRRDAKVQRMNRQIRLSSLVPTKGMTGRNNLINASKGRTKPLLITGMVGQRSSNDSG